MSVPACPAPTYSALVNGGQKFAGPDMEGIVHHVDALQSLELPANVDKEPLHGSLPLRGYMQRNNREGNANFTMKVNEQ